MVNWCPAPSPVSKKYSAIGKAMGDVGRGVFEVISDMAGVDKSMEWMIRLTTETGLPISLAALGDGPTGPGIRRRLEFMKQANAAGARLVSQIAVRSPGQLMGLETSSNPLIGRPSYDAIAHLPLSERVARMRNPQLRARIIAEMPAEDWNHFNMPTAGYANLFALGEPPNYEPVREMCLEEIAKREANRRRRHTTTR